MTDPRYPAFQISRAIPLQNRDYYTYLKSSIRSARYRIWSSIFIINIAREHDYRAEVRRTLNQLARKRSLGVDVRVITGTSRTTPAIRESNEIARRYLVAKRVPVKTYEGTKSSTHSKYVIVDYDLIILGSHNWTMNAFSKSEEDSIALHSEALNRELSDQFLSTWVD